MTTEQRQWSFPILDNVEIIECMRELGCPMTEEQLTKPSPDFIAKVYEELLGLFLGYSPDDAQQMQFSGVDCFEHPQLHDQSVGQLAFWRALTKLAEASGFSNFSVRDVMKPEYARVRRFLSAVINFAKFREEKVAAFEDMVEEAETLVEQKENAEAEHNDMARELKQLRRQRDEEKAQAEQLERQTAEQQDNLTRQKNRLQDLQRHTSALADLRDELSQNKEGHENALGSLHDDIERLRAQIVQSPDRVKGEIASKQAQLDKENAFANEKTEAALALRRKVDALSTTRSGMDKALQVVNACEEEHMKFKDAKAKVTSVQRQLGEARSVQREAEMKEAVLQKQFGFAQERKEDAEARRAVRLTEANKEFNRAMESKAQAEADFRNAETRARLLDEETRKIGEQTAEVRAQAQEEDEAARRQYGDLEAAVFEYGHKLVAALESTA